MLSPRRQDARPIFKARLACDDECIVMRSRIAGKRSAALALALLGMPAQSDLEHKLAQAGSDAKKRAAGAITALSTVS